MPRFITQGKLFLQKNFTVYNIVTIHPLQTTTTTDRQTTTVP